MLPLLPLQAALATPQPGDLADCGRRAGEQAIQGCSRIIAAERKPGIPIADPDHLAIIYVNRGFAYRNRGDYKQALADFDTAIELYPEHAYAHNNRGRTYQAMSEYDRAIDNYSKAIELKPAYAYAYNNRGTAYEKKGDYEKAIADYSSAIKHHPYFAAAYLNRGLIYERRGDNKRAESDYRQALKLNPSDDIARANLRRLDRQASRSSAEMTVVY